MKALSFIKRFNPVGFLISVFVLAFAWPVYSYMIKGSEVRLDTSDFDGNLSSTTNTAQKLADVIDQLPLAGDAYDKIEFIIDSRGGVITAGSSGTKAVSSGGTITSWEITSSSSGSAVVDIQKTTYGNFPNSFASIAASAKPTLSASVKNQDLTLTGWTTSLTKGDRVRAVVDSADITGVVVITLYVTKG